MRGALLAWSLFGLYVLLALGALWVALTEAGAVEEPFVVLCVGFALVGALVASHEPDNPVGWLMLVIGLAFVTAIFTTLYATAQQFPATTAVGWVSGWVWNVWLFLGAVILPLLFPDGRLLSRRWRVVVALAVLGLLLSILAVMISPHGIELDKGVTIPNPTGVPGAASVASALGGIGNALGGVCFVLAGGSLLVRLRRSHGRAKQQVKWFVYVGTLVVAGMGLALVELPVQAAPGPEPQWSQVIGTIGWSTGLLAIVVGFPVAIGIAILRHRLYDIDVVINRTLVYGSLTVLLAATYFALVIGLRFLLRPVTGESDLAVAASTLAVAGLFRPARARIQSVVDRRFFRSRYDATRTLEGFAAQLRNQLDLDALGYDLRDVVSTTMQPAHVSLWLRRVP